MSQPDDPQDESGASVPGLPDLDMLGGDLGGLLAQAQDMMAAQAAAAEQEVEGVAGGGVVRIRATGTGQVLSVHLAPEVVDPADVSMLEDLVLAALHDVNARLAELQRAALGPLGALLGGGDLGGDLLGGDLLGGGQGGDLLEVDVVDDDPSDAGNRAAADED